VNGEKLLDCQCASRNAFVWININFCFSLRARDGEPTVRVNLTSVEGKPAGEGLMRTQIASLASGLVKKNW